MEQIRFIRKDRRERCQKNYYSAIKCLFLLLFTVQSLLSSAQTPLLNLSMKNVSLHEILMEIKKQSGKDLVYNNNLIDKFNNETIELKNTRTEDVLKKVLEGKNLYYKIIDNVIIIEPKSEKQNSGLKVQTTITGVVTDSLNNPIPFASVYLSKTTIGVITDNKGVYSITIPKDGEYEMIISCIGYKLNSQVISTEVKKQIINAKLHENIFMLNEVTIKAKDKNRRKNYAQFIKSFIGETHNSQNCNIINPEDMHLYMDTENNILRGYSLKPLKIENKALGYTLLYDLVDFSYNYNTRILRFSGYNHFQQLIGTSKRNEIWEHNRLATYYGSKMHLLRALFADSLGKEGYKLFECKFDTVTKGYSIVKPVQVEKIRFVTNKNFVTLIYNDTLLINYTDNHPELSPEQIAPQPKSIVRNYGGISVSYPIEDRKATSATVVSKPKEYNSFIYFSDTLKLYRNSYYYKPYSITWKGEMANERIADILPYDYLPENIGNYKSDTLYTKGETTINNTIKVESIQGAEKVYLHTDRTYYNSGDDIWFKSYVINASTNKPSLSNNNLHVELVSSTSEIIQSRILRIEAGTGNGDFHISNSLPSGSYIIRAYTNYMRNFDDHFFFSKEIIIINPNDGGNDLSDSTKYVERKIDITFFPEGGSLVDNVSSVVAFKAVNALGKGCDISGELFSSKGDLINTFESTHLGMGSFLFEPVPGLSYFAKVKSQQGANVQSAFPASFRTGITMSAFITIDKKLLLTVNTNEITLPSVFNRDFILRFSSRNLLTWSTNIKINSLTNNYLIASDNLPDGIIKVTLIGSEGSPICERLVYLQTNKDVHLNVTTVKKEYKPRENITSVVSLSGDTSLISGASLSFSAADARFNNSPSSWPTTIASWFLLESDVKGPIEEPSYYFDTSNQNRLQDLDLLLQTQGWRDFQWKYDSISSFNHEFGFTASGKVLSILNKKPVENAKINLGIFKYNTKQFLNTETDSIGHFSIEGIDISGRADIFISATGKKERADGRIYLDSLFYEHAKLENVDLFHNEQVQKPANYSILRHEVVLKNMLEKKYSLNDTINIGEVIITGKKATTPQMNTVNESRRTYGTPDKELIITPTTENYGGDVFSFISGRIAGVRVKQNPLDPSNVMVSIRGQKGAALILLNGAVVDSLNYNTLTMLNMNMVDRIDVIYASPMYGMSGANGVVNIITRNGLRRGPIELGPNSATTEIKGFDAPRIFYSPKHLNDSQQPYVPDTRTTIFWEPNITVKKTNSVTLNYFNGDGPTAIELIVEGITNEGIPVTSRTRYEVR